MDLLNRLTSNGSKNHMSTHTTPTRPSPPTATTISSKPTPSTRNINTTRSLKAPKDASTVDFAIMPQEFSGASSSVRTSELSRVPLLHNNYTPDRSGAHAPAVSDFDESAPRGPTIATLAADSTHVSAPSPMADVHDNNAAPVDWHDVAHRMEDVSRSVGERVAARGSEGEAKEDQGVFKQVWEGLVEDVLGRKRVVSP
ncbi:MAG: hypothetical protein M1831_003235 [Alyxoria varia]|nr:MAG: hypothetical protein M1831_003235 [Alyxoria varia]